MLPTIAGLTLVLPLVHSQSHVELNHEEGVCADKGYANIMSSVECNAALIELNYTESEAHITWDTADTAHPTGCTFKIDERQGHFNPGLNGVTNPNFLNICVVSESTKAVTNTMSVSTAAGTPAPTMAMSENMTTVAPYTSSPFPPAPFLSSTSPSSPTDGTAELMPWSGGALVA